MLSPREDDEDEDNHLCIKCNATIVGLDNYVKHRKERCGKIKNDTPKPSLQAIDPLESHYNLCADVFFQSLELQSSVKKTSLTRLTPPIPTSKTNDGKTSAIASTSNDIPRMSPVETNLKGEDWIGGHSLKIGTNVDNQTKLINAVANISGNVKKDIPTSYNMCYEDSEGSEVLDDDDDEEDEHVSGGKWKPPPNYTGGKWRPASPENEDWDMNDQEHSDGKWKLMMPEGNDRDDDYDAPPPGHTKGKWVPGANEKTQIMQPTIQTKGSVLYWCGPCNRRLGSRAIYDKHLQSTLHLKKVLPEHELEFSGHLEPLKIEKRVTRTTKFLNDSSSARNRKRKKTSKLCVKIEKKKRKRKPKFLRCAGCKSRVRQHYMGKHLISHYHFRKASVINNSVYQELILDNIDAIVHQSPFQCSPCKFYTNWFSNFIQHWYSDEHEEKLASITGRLWCSFCKFECETSQEMLEHISSSEHQEVIAVINRSMPIIVRKKTIIKCEVCSQEFKYNIEMKKHSEKTGHTLFFTSTDDYQELHKCQHCGAKFKSSLTLAAHLKSKHKQRAYLCLVCQKTFDSSEEAKTHRQSSEHRIRRYEILKEQGVLSKDLSKKCPYCTETVTLKNVLDLKDHIQTVHPNNKKKCPKCGMAFILSQEVTRHIRSNACQFQPCTSNTSTFWRCSQCLFTTDSQAECFFHEVLHTVPIQETKTVDDRQKVILKFACPLCPKVFKKTSLRDHLRQHTFERPFVCGICGANFTRQTSLVNHKRNEHSSVVKISKLSKVMERIEDPKVEWECENCQNKFSSRTSLSRHVASCCVRTGELFKCTNDQCTYVSSTLSQLNRHRRYHDERVKLHECALCSFKTDQASHMKRHMICHKGVKPYACPYCNFKCGSLENLRKHVLRSGRHRGVRLYRCGQCGLGTDRAVELRAHLVTAHGDRYDAKSAAVAVRDHLVIAEFKTLDNKETH